MFLKSFAVAAVVISASSSHAQCFPPVYGSEATDSSAPEQAAPVVPQCGSYILELDPKNNRLDVSRDYGRNASAVRVFSLTKASLELQQGGLDVQTDEPKDWVSIKEITDPKCGPTGRFEAVYKDHRLVYQGEKSFTVPDYTRFACNDAANEILKKVLLDAKSSR